jgi:hypothetical protein
MTTITNAGNEDGKYSENGGKDLVDRLTVRLE